MEDPEEERVVERYDEPLVFPELKPDEGRTVELRVVLPDRTVLDELPTFPELVLERFTVVEREELDRLTVV